MATKQQTEEQGSWFLYEENSIYYMIGILMNGYDTHVLNRFPRTDKYEQRQWF